VNKSLALAKTRLHVLEKSALSRPQIVPSNTHSYMVVIRLRREGTKDRPFYRIVAADQRFQRDGRFLEILGTYNPMTKDSAITLNTERADYWLSVGAQPSETVRSIIKRAKAAK
jgi:small subunit ribosomal protein S16